MILCGRVDFNTYRMSVYLQQMSRPKKRVYELLLPGSQRTEDLCEVFEVNETKKKKKKDGTTI